MPPAVAFPDHVFREYDIRGVADRDLSDELIESIGARFAEGLRPSAAEGTSSKGPSIALARDGRLSSERLFAALTRGLVSAGAQVIDVGIGPTPLLYFAAHHLHTDGAMMITGSHNPAPDNGIKLMRGKASFFGADLQELKDRVKRAGTGSPVAASPGSIARKDVSDAYLENLLGSSTLVADLARAAKKPRFVVDAGNGAAGPLALRAFAAFGLEPDALFCNIDGRFPNHHPDPTVVENLEALRLKVASTTAEIGIAFDGDGDRLGAIDERGNVIWGDQLMILFSRGLLEERPGATILGEVKCSQTLFTDIEKHGGKALYSKTGHSLIKTRMKEEGALLAGEMSGHLFFGDRYLGFDDAIYAALRLLEIVVRSQKSLSGLLADVPRTFSTAELRVDCADSLKFDLVGKVTSHFKKLYPVLDLDGARIDFGQGAWGLCRASNTQPVLVLRFEALSEARLTAIRFEVESVVESAHLELASHGERRA